MTSEALVAAHSQSRGLGRKEKGGLLKARGFYEGETTKEELQ